jgi:hypothetical protein
MEAHALGPRPVEPHRAVEDQPGEEDEEVARVPAGGARWVVAVADGVGHAVAAVTSILAVDTVAAVTTRLAVLAVLSVPPWGSRLAVDPRRPA